jgi:uncharacterized coiled-coil DUF342 family protein
MENVIKKTNTQLLKEIQNLVDDIDKYKAEIETLLSVIDSLEKKYYDLTVEIKQNNKK